MEFAIESLRDGQRLSLGDVTLEILATPGHTPESICIVVYEHANDDVPYGVLTGDTLFVGDVGWDESTPVLLPGESWWNGDVACVAGEDEVTCSAAGGVLHVSATGAGGVG